MRVPIYQVDAFTNRLFGGNPAAVCPLDAWLPDTTLQAIAAENNLAETAFIVAQGPDFSIRWFTPTVEVELCGHATLASAYVVFNRLGFKGERIAFHTRKAGVVYVARKGDLLALDFPAWPSKKVPMVAAAASALGTSPMEMWTARDLLVVYEKASEVRALTPKFDALASLEWHAVIATAPGDEGTDYVSRFFAPAIGIPEDPATGSSQCTLAPYWANRLGKTKLTARQVSARGGEFACSLEGDRVSIAGHAILFLEGHIEV